MSSKRHLRRAQCGHKRAFPTAGAATAAMRAMQHLTHARYSVYACDFCHHYHWGHTPGPGRLRRGHAGKLA